MFEFLIEKVEKDLEIDATRGKSFFFYLQLRAAMKAYGVPWGVPLLTHPLHKTFAVHRQTRVMVSKLY